MCAAGESTVVTMNQEEKKTQGFFRAIDRGKKNHIAGGSKRRQKQTSSLGTKMKSKP